jgi:RNA polymerase sigma-70 factor (ECF subfamily)
MDRERLQSEAQELYRAHAAALLRFGVAFCGDSDVAQDALQETFLRYYAERRFGREITYPRAWMYQVLRNYLMDRHRSAQPFHSVEAEMLATMPDPAQDPEWMVQRAQIAGRIAVSLSPRESECLQLRADGLSYTEIAAEMDLRIGTVGALLARANRKIRDTAVKSRAHDTCVAGAVHDLFLRPEPAA